MRTPYPLQWPESRTRTAPDARRRSRFHSWDDLGKRPLRSPYDAAKQLMAELRLLGANHVVVTSDLPTRPDGLPYADGRSPDPGVAVWCVYQGHERVFACDCWRTHAENIRAISLSIAALRGLARWGMADVVEQAFAGFAALPPGTPASPSPSPRTWRDVFDMNDHVRDMPLTLLRIVKQRYRNLVATCHPDNGHAPERLVELNLAMEAAERELAGMTGPEAAEPEVEDDRPTIDLIDLLKSL